MTTEIKDLNLRRILVEAGRELADVLQLDSSYYFVVDLGKADPDYRGEKLIVPYDHEKFSKCVVKAFPASDLAGRLQLVNGFVVSSEVAELSGFVAVPYVPQPTMYLKIS